MVKSKSLHYLMHVTNIYIASERLAVLLAVNQKDAMRRTVLDKEKATLAKALEELKALS